MITAGAIPNVTISDQLFTKFALGVQKPRSSTVQAVQHHTGDNQQRRIGRIL
jgi:hypothetical protein